MSKNSFQLTKKELKEFSKKFLHKDGRNVSVEDVYRVIERFVTPPKEYNTSLANTFRETRSKLLKTCLNTNTPVERWKKCKNLLIEDTNTWSLNKNVDNISIVRGLITPATFTSKCIEAIVFFNAADIKHPNGVKFRPSEPSTFPSYRFEHPGTILRLYAKDKGLIAEKLVMDYDPDRYYFDYSILRDKETDEFYHVIHEKFYKEFIKNYPEIAKSYKLKQGMKPREILKVINPDTQVKFLQQFTGSKSTQYIWENVGEKYSIKLIIQDVSRIVKDYFPEIEEETKIQGINRQIIGYKPYDRLLNERLLRIELADLYLQQLSLFERKKILLDLKDEIKGFSIFEFKTFRDLVYEWGNNNKNIKNVLQLMEELKSDYSGKIPYAKEYDKWVEYVKIYELIQQGCKKMKAYQIVSPESKPKTTAKRYERCIKELKTQKFNTGNPEHIKQVKSKYNIPDILHVPLLNTRKVS